MKKIFLKLMCVIMMMTLAMTPVLAAAAARDMLVLGADLTEKQRETVLGMLGVSSPDDVDEVLYVTIDDEKSLMSALVTADKIGSKSISSARVTLLEEDAGLTVKTRNITYITEAMYASALITAGITDAEVTVAAPVNVSGTAALAGIFKAYEVASNATLDSLAKAIASEELLLSGELAEFIGSEEAVRLIAELKQMVIDNGWDNAETIGPAVDDVLNQMGVSLTPGQREQVVSLLLKFCSLDMDAEDIAKQLQGIVKTAQAAASAQSKIAEFMGKVTDVFASIGNWFKGIFKR